MLNHLLQIRRNKIALRENNHLVMSMAHARQWTIFIFCVFALLACWTVDAPAATPVSTDMADFPPSLESYNDGQMEGILAILVHRVRQEPFNLVVTQRG